MHFTHRELRKFNSDARKLIMKVQEAGWRGDRISLHGAVLLAPDNQPFRICVPRSVNGRLLNNTMAPFKRWMLQQHELPTPTTEEVDMPACITCGKTFDRKQQVAVHHAMVHDLKECDTCGRKMSATNLTRHKKSAHATKVEIDADNRMHLVDNEGTPVDTEAPLTLAGIELPPAAFENFPADLPHGADYFKPSVDQVHESPVDQLASIRAIVAPDLMKRIAELERLLVNQSVVHKRELEECSAKLDLIRGLL